MSLDEIVGEIPVHVRCKIWRLYHGLSKRELARRAGVHWNTIQNIETGRHIGAEALQKIMAALNER